MKKSLAAILTLVTLMPLVACDFSENTEGGMITIDASKISRTPKKVEQTFKYKNHSFTFYNVYNDGNGNFVMADDSGYIYNDDIQFGLGVGTKFVYQIEDGEEKLIDYKAFEDGLYFFSIINFGFKIRGCDITLSSIRENINIGKISHWC